MKSFSGRQLWKCGICCRFFNKNNQSTDFAFIHTRDLKQDSNEEKAKKSREKRRERGKKTEMRRNKVRSVKKDNEDLKERRKTVGAINEKM